MRHALLAASLTLLGTAAAATAQQSGLTPLQVATQHGKDAMAKLLRDAGAKR